MKYLRILSMVVLIGLLFLSPRLFANVFAHNIRYTQQGTQDPFDGRFTDGTGMSIRFVLSDHADSVVAVIKSGATPLRTIKVTNLLIGDASLDWDGKDGSGVFVPIGNYTVTLTTYDKGYGAYTEISYPNAVGLSMRGMTTVNNPALKNFGYIFDVDNGGFLGTVGVGRFTADGQPWGDSKNVNKLTTTGIALGPGEARWGSQADKDGYVYVLGRTAKQVYRYHTDSLNVVLVDSGYGAYYPYGLAIMEETAGKTIALVTNVNSGTATFTGDSRVLSFHIGSASGKYFGAKDTLLKRASVDSVMYWDAAFGRDSALYVSFLYNGGKPRSGVAKFNLKGRTGPFTMADTVWTVKSDSGYASTLSMFFGAAIDGSSDILYFVNARIASGNPPTGQGIYSITGLTTTTPAKVKVYADKQENASTVRSDISVDAVGNIVYFENSNEEIAVISPSTGANSFTTTSPVGFNVLFAPAKVMDTFDAGSGHFNNPPTFSGSTVGISTSSTAAQTTKQFLHGAGAMEVTLLDDPVSASPWEVRFLSGTGSPANNDSLAATGWVGYWMRTNSAPYGAMTAIGLDDPSDPVTKRSIKKPVIGDGSWHLYQWNIGDSTKWTPWVVTSGSPKIKGPQVTIDAVWFFAPDSSKPWTLDLDDVSFNPAGQVGVDAGTGDVTLNGSISALDASWILQYAVSLRKFSPDQLMTADVNLSDGGATANAVDAATVLSAVIGKIPALPFTLPLPTSLENTNHKDPAPLSIILASVNGSVGQTVTIPISVPQDLAGVHSAQMKLIYNSSLLKIHSVSSTSLTKDFMVESNIGDGSVAIAMASGDGLTAGGQILSVQAEILQSSADAGLRLVDVWLNDQKISSVTSVGGVGQNVPTAYNLLQNYPNPFNPSTTIEYQLPQTGFVELKVYDITGREVSTLVSNVQNAGYYRVNWNAVDSRGSKVASGVYLYRITAGSFTQIKKMMLLK